MFSKHKYKYSKYIYIYDIHVANANWLVCGKFHKHPVLTWDLTRQGWEQYRTAAMMRFLKKNHIHACKHMGWMKDFIDVFTLHLKKLRKRRTPLKHLLHLLFCVKPLGYRDLGFPWSLLNMLNLLFERVLTGLWGLKGTPNPNWEIYTNLGFVYLNTSEKIPYIYLCCDLMFSPC